MTLYLLETFPMLLGEEELPLLSLIFTFALLHNKAGGFPEGVSLEFARAIEKRYPDPGGFLETREEWQHLAAENLGKHKVPTLRNVDKKPGIGFTKAYMHNGVFKSLKEVVNFYNARDVESWPPPEVPENVNTEELGDLGLTGAEEDAIVAFMKTLSDGYRLEH